jgi:uncharacterized protein (DUF58 family)
MIFPANRLLLAFAAVMLPAALLWAALPPALPWAALACVLFFGLCGVDAWRARRVLDGIGLEVAERYNLTHHRDGECNFFVSGARVLPGKLRLGLELPAGLSSRWHDCRIDLAAAPGRTKVSWPLRPDLRGSFELQSCWLQTCSPLGLWIRQEARSMSARVHVYPNLASARKQLAALFLNRGMAGFHLQRLVGQGREFEKLRNYLSGDSLGDIHWRSSAKRSELVTKEYQIERTQRIYVVIDASRLSARDSGDQPVLERYISASLALNLVAQKQGDLFGLVSFSDRVHNFVRAKAGQPNLRVCQEALINLRPRSVNPDFGELASFLALRLHHRALVLFLTSLDETALAEQFQTSLGLVNRKHLVLVNMLRPPAARPLFAEESLTSPEQVYQKLGGHLAWRELRELGRNLKHQGVDFHLLERETLFVELVSQYLNVKRRQLL